MYIEFGTKKLRKRCENYQRAIRAWGAVRAKKIYQRISEIRAAESLAELRLLPGPRCHRLKHQLTGKYSLDLDGPYRLIVEPIAEDQATKSDSALNESEITAVRIIEVRDTHA